MNQYIKSQIMNLTMTLQSFEKTLEIAARKDDGKIDKEEQKQIDKIKKATEKYIKELSKI